MRDLSKVTLNKIFGDEDSLLAVIGGKLARIGKSDIAQKLGIKSVANNLTTTEEGFVLDARQGKALKDAQDTLNNSLGKKANSDHTHDNRYYTETEIDNKFNDVNQSFKWKFIGQSNGGNPVSLPNEWKELKILVCYGTEHYEFSVIKEEVEKVSSCYFRNGYPYNGKNNLIIELVTRTEAKLYAFLCDGADVMGIATTYVWYR